MPRFSSLPLLLSLALPTALIVQVMAPAVAEAQQTALAEPLVRLVPADQLLGDGKTSTTLHFVALGTDGKPLTGLNGRVSATQGTPGRIEGGEGGLYSFSYTPPAVNVATEVKFTLRVKSSATANLVQEGKVTVVPSTAHAVALSANPAQVVLGQDAASTVTITLSGGAESTLAGADLAVRASSGTVANVTGLGGGRYSMLFTAPDKKFPHLAVVTLVDRRDPSRTYGALAIPMSGRTPFPVTGLPDSNILVKVAGVEFGPVVADAQGKATVTLTVPPGVGEATVISIKGEQRDEKTIDLKVPASPRVQLMPIPDTLPSDGSRTQTLRAFVAQPDGKPDTGAKVSFTVGSGTVGAARHDSGGIYIAEWTPASQARGGTTSVEVSVEDAKGPQKDSAEVTLGAALPESLMLELDGAVGADRRFKVLAQTNGGPNAKGVAMSVANGTADGAPADKGPGKVGAGFTSGASGQTVVQAVTRVDASTNRLARTLVFPANARLVNDASSALPVTVLTVDAHGFPVANQPVALSVVEGDATIPASLVTDSNGIGQVTLTAGTARGLVVVQASSGGTQGSAGVLQVPAGVSDLSMPVTGDALAVSLRQRWAPLVKTLVQGGTNAGVAATASASAQATASASTTTPAATGARTLGAAVTALEVSASADKLSAGQTVTITIQAKDAQGKGLAGRQVQVFTNAGSAGAVTDKGGGSYTTQLTAPAGGTDVIRVTVVSPESGLSKMLEIPMSAAEPVWGLSPGVPANGGPLEGSVVREAPVIADSAPATTPAETKTPKEPKEPKAEGDHPWLRAQAGFIGGVYSYRQVPFTSDGPLYGERIAFGGGESAAAGNVGLSLQADAWVPGLDFLGGRASFRTSRYAVELADFGEVIPDWLNELEVLALARLPIDSGSVRVSPALRVGFGITDFMVYRQDLSGPSPVLDYGPLITPSLNVGAEVGLDIDRTVHIAAGATLGLNGGGRSTYSRGFDLEIAWAFLDPLYAYGRLEYLARGTGVYASQDGANQLVGDLDDAMTTVSVGVGLQF